VKLASGKLFAGTRLWIAQLVLFSALGWIFAGILDGVGALHLADALFVSGLVLLVLAGLLALEGSDAPVALTLRISPKVSMFGFAGRIGLGIPLSRAQALAVVSAGVAAGGLLASGIAIS